jgi:hypothetical protein
LTSGSFESSALSADTSSLLFSYKNNDFVGQATKRGQFSNSDWIERPNGRTGNPEIIQQTRSGVNAVNNHARNGEGHANDARRYLTIGLNQFATPAGIQMMKSMAGGARDALDKLKNQIGLAADKAGQGAGVLGRSNPDSARTYSEYAGSILTGMTTARVRLSKDLAKLDRQITTSTRKFRGGA